MEDGVIDIIKDKGPMTGSELEKISGGDPLLLLRVCRLSDKLSIMTIGTRYLRFDRNIEGYARLSPSILREFLTYSVIGLAIDPGPIEKRALEIESNIERISRAKSDLAYNIVSSIMDRFEYNLQERICFIIAGDIVFNMAHEVPRPERSTGKMVKGSDMDIVVIVDDKFPERQKARLDEEIYKEKFSLLLNPYMKEEIDYIVKDISRVKEQVKFETFKHMVACKILHEGTLLFGSEDIFHTVKRLLREEGVNEKIDALERSAREFRLKAEYYLLKEDIEKIKKDSYHLFYPTEESEEFE
jgi:hypothetical protein